MKSSKKQISALILCAGSGSRSGLIYNKIFYLMGRKTVLEMVLDSFVDAEIDDITLVISPTDQQEIASIVQGKYNVRMCHGGKTRAESVRNGLNFIKNSVDIMRDDKNCGDCISTCDIVVIHDGARPYVNAKLIRDSVQSAAQFGSGICAIKSTDTLKKVVDCNIVCNIDRENIYQMQTPQTFDFEQILLAYNNYFDYFLAAKEQESLPKTTHESWINSAEQSEPTISSSLDQSESTISSSLDQTTWAINSSFVATDDSEVYLLAGFTPKIVQGSKDNIKITAPADLYAVFAGNLLIGNGFDVHQTQACGELILGGVKIAHDKGLLGHSDADVLIHAIMDALLSAAGLADIGVLFPNTSQEFKDISSIVLLKNVKKLLSAAQLHVRNISAVIIAQAPKLSPYIQNMRANIASALEIDSNLVNISATTTETLGLIGQEKGIAASAVCLIEK